MPRHSSPWVEAMKMPLWPDPPFTLPEGLEARKDPSRDLAALRRVGTSLVVGFVPSRFDPSNLPALIARL